MKTLDILSRRSFIKAGTAGAVALGSLSLPGFARANAGGDYKALVEIRLGGGNDAVNTLMALDDDGFEQYRNVRRHMALDREGLLPVLEGSYGFNGAMPEIQRLFNGGTCAVVANIGSLVEPVTQASLQNGSVSIPRAVGGHTDQTAQWAWGEAKCANKLGWMGRVTDQMAERHRPNTFPMNVTFGGNTSIRGQHLPVFSGSPWSSRWRTPDPMSFTRHNNSLSNAKERLLQRSFRHRLKATFQGRAQETISEAEMMSRVVASLPSLRTQFPETSLGMRLKKIAQTIAIRNSPNVRATRQVFGTGFGNFDTHSGGLAGHNTLLRELSEAVGAFQAALEELGVADQVTTFTTSEFGRTVTPNENGTDHGWGGHQMVFGGAVNGNAIYGQMPDLDPEGTDVIGRRVALIPTLAVEQYLAPLASWFGLSQGQIDTVFPNRAAFGGQRLAFLG